MARAILITILVAVGTLVAPCHALTAGPRPSANADADADAQTKTANLRAAVDLASRCNDSVTPAVLHAVALIDSIEIAHPAAAPRAWTTEACVAAVEALAPMARPALTMALATAATAMLGALQALATAIDALNEELAQPGGARDAGDPIVAAATKVAAELKLLGQAKMGLSTAIAAGKLTLLRHDVAQRKLTRKTAPFAYYDAVAALAQRELVDAVAARHFRALRAPLASLGRASRKLTALAASQPLLQPRTKALAALYAATAALTAHWREAEIDAFDLAAQAADDAALPPLPSPRDSQ